MKKLVVFLCAVALAFGVTGMASALTYVEDFEDPFPTWESGWLGINTNLQNIYGVGEGRGNNPDGLWFDDGDGQYLYDDLVEIFFDPTFGATLSSFDIDIAGYVPIRLQVFDMSNALLLDVDVVLTYSLTDPGVYSHYSATSTSGISRFSFVCQGGVGQNIEGNTSIDNVQVATSDQSPVPEPATLLLFGSGLIGLAGISRKFKK